MFILIFTEPLVDIEDVLLSDGEDFGEDEILQDLRRRRLYHIQKLKAIDRLLANSEQG